MKKSAFTLIELLVVIAIIAVLAAILFPVFAQAKAAAKAAASISNEKQISLAILMYGNDYDDLAPIDCIWGQSDAYYSLGSAATRYSPWSWEIVKYAKNGEIFQDPQTDKEPVPSTDSPTARYAYNPQYGYNYTALSPIISTSGSGINIWVRQPTAFQSLPKPAETVMIGTHNKSSEVVGTYWFGAGTILIAPFTVEPPDCLEIAPVCLDSWGSGWYATMYLRGNRTAGAFTGMNSLRKNGQSIVGFTDGHVKTMQPGALAAGTNWNPTINDTQVTVVNPAAYLWGNFN